MQHDLSSTADPKRCGARGEQGRRKQGQRYYLADGAVGARADGRREGRTKRCWLFKVWKEKFSPWCNPRLCPTHIPSPTPQGWTKTYT